MFKIESAFDSQTLKNWQGNIPKLIWEGQHTARKKTTGHISDNTKTKILKKEINWEMELNIKLKGSVKWLNGPSWINSQFKTHRNIVSTECY